MSKAGAGKGVTGAFAFPPSDSPQLKIHKKKHPCRVLLLMELVMGVGPMNLVITNDALYQLSYTSDFATYVLYIKDRHNASPFFIIYCFCRYLSPGLTFPMRLYTKRRRNILLPIHNKHK